MGKKKLAVVGEEEQKRAKSEIEAKKKSVKAPGLAGGQRIKDMSATAVVIEEPVLIEPAEEAPQEKKEVKTKKLPKVRGKKYQNAKKMIDPALTYPIEEAIKLVKKTSFSKFGGSLEAHLKVKKVGLTGEAQLPHLRAKEKKVAIFSPEILEKIKGGKIDFEILLASPKDMPQLVPFAKVLGPKGLMPNPKNGTIVDDPEKAKKKFSSPAFSFKTEKDFPIIHTVFGKFEQKDDELAANFKALIAAIGPNNIQRTIIKSTMGPSLKVKFE